MAFTETCHSALLRYLPACRVLFAEINQAKDASLGISHLRPGLGTSALPTKLGEVSSFSPALAELSLKIISKNMTAIFTITGHSGISQCFLRLVPNFVLRSGCIYGHWTSKPGSRRGEHYPGAWGSHIPEIDEHRASHSGTCHGGFCHGSGSHHVSRRWQVCRPCLPKLCRANSCSWVQTPPHPPPLPSRSDLAILNQYTAFGSRIMETGVLQQLMLFQAQWAGVNMQRELLVPAEAGVTGKMCPSLFHHSLISKEWFIHLPFTQIEGNLLCFLILSHLFSLHLSLTQNLI